ncbi:MAG: histidine--tRNA ligase [Pseudomonadota bacterium]
MAKQSIKLTAVKGMEDIMPPTSRLWQHVEAKARRIFDLYGYGEVRTPILEPTELFARGVGETTSIVEKEMYTFEDRGGDLLSLRPEGTASIVRAYIESGAASTDPVAGYYYMGPMFRRERPQKGRQRQFFQIGCELLGAASPLADVEVIAMNDHFLKEVGVGEITLEINSLGCPKCRPSYDKALLKYLHDCKGKLCEDCKRRVERNPLRVFDCKNQDCHGLLNKAPLFCDYWCDECKAHFGAVKEELGLLKIDYKENPRIVRGLDYYMRTAFEFTTTKLGAQNAIAAGGRYDGLVKSFGGPDVAGVGCALGVERLLLMLKESAKETAPEDIVFFAVLGDEARNKLFPTIQMLRYDGKHVEWDYAGRSLKAQMRRANKLKAQTVVIVGDEEMKKGEAQVKDMVTGEQSTVSIKDLVKVLV